MARLARRNFLIVAAAFLLGLGSATTAQAQTGNWEYSEDLGGWLDWSTGLVWGEHSAVLNTGAWSLNGTNKTYLPNYRAATGIAAWRLPTRAEVADAASRRLDLVIMPPQPPGTSPNSLGYNCWTSTMKGSSSAFVANIRTGGGGYYSTKSYTNVVPVYRAFAP